MPGVCCRLQSGYKPGSGRGWDKEGERVVSVGSQVSSFDGCQAGCWQVWLPHRGYIYGQYVAESKHIVCCHCRAYHDLSRQGPLAEQAGRIEWQLWNPRCGRCAGDVAQKWLGCASSWLLYRHDALPNPHNVSSNPAICFRSGTALLHGVLIRAHESRIRQTGRGQPAG